MVVLENSSMLSSGSNQYLQPDYLSPLPTTLDAKKSPLALLAQTCSQIGADPPATKSLLPSLDKKKTSPSTDGSSRAGPSPVATATNLSKSAARSSPPSAPEPSKLAFKPYETNVVTKKEERPSSKGEEGRRSVPESRASSRKSSTSSPNSAKSEDSDKAEGASPIIRSGMEILSGHPKDMPLGTYRPSSLGNLSNLGCCPPGLDPSNPAFRPPYAGAPFSHHLMGGYGAGPYLSYARVKTAAGGEALVPVCKDPYCTGCQYSMHGANMLGAAGQCPSGCTQCEHQKYGLAAAALGMIPPGFSYGPLGRPYVCSWMVGEAYCGKRFTSPDELLQHLRTHTAPTSAADPASLLYRYPNPPLSPLSAARYHPYAKPSGLPPSPFSAFNPTSLSQFYSPYSLYGQRLGAAVHP